MKVIDSNNAWWKPETNLFLLFVFCLLNGFVNNTHDTELKHRTNMNLELPKVWYFMICRLWALVNIIMNLHVP